jgi:hypothetical protein
MTLHARLAQTSARRPWRAVRNEHRYPAHARRAWRIRTNAGHQTASLLVVRSSTLEDALNTNETNARRKRSQRRRIGNGESTGTVDLRQLTTCLRVPPSLAATGFQEICPVLTTLFRAYCDALSGIKRADTANEKPVRIRFRAQQPPTWLASQTVSDDTGISHHCAVNRYDCRSVV